MPFHVLVYTEAAQLQLPGAASIKFNHNKLVM